MFALIGVAYRYRRENSNYIFKPLDEVESVRIDEKCQVIFQYRDMKFPKERLAFTVMDLRNFNILKYCDYNTFQNLIKACGLIGNLYGNGRVEYFLVSVEPIKFLASYLEFDMKNVSSNVEVCSLSRNLNNIKSISIDNRKGIDIEYGDKYTEQHFYGRVLDIGLSNKELENKFWEDLIIRKMLN